MQFTNSKLAPLLKPMASYALAAVLLWLLLAAGLPAVGAVPPPQPSSDCSRNCGSVHIPYPFGVGPAESCAMPGFGNMTCNRTENGDDKPFLWNVEVVNISLPDGRIRVMNEISTFCYNITSKTMDNQSNWQLNLKHSAYRLSDKDNMFTAIGCQTLAYISDENKFGKFMSGCVAMCRRGDVTTLTNDSCSGIGCCQTAIPAGLQFYKVWFDPNFNTTAIHSVSRCSYAVLLESKSFNFSTSYVTTSEFNDTYAGRMPVVLDWAIGKETCEAASKKPESYACVSDNSNCSNSPNGGGYICNCREGFDGNPYLLDDDFGCKDIDECDGKPNPCSPPEMCHNRAGYFECLCRWGYIKRNATTCERDLTLPIGATTAVLIGMISFLAIEVIRNKRRIRQQTKERQSDEYFRQHGGQLLVEMVNAEGNIRFTIYRREEIEAATNNFNKAHVIGEGGQGTVYKATLGDDVVAIKSCKELDESRMRDFLQELVVLCRVNHPNVVKLLGCCLQFEAPMLVYEFVQNQTLMHLLRNKRYRVTLGTRLSIAADSAEAFAHLHSLQHPILHGDVKSANILLGEGWVAKVSDFGCSKIDDDGKIQVVAWGTPGYLDPEYLHDYQLTAKNDVYSFGVILLELLTGKEPLSKERLSLTSVFQDCMKDGTLDQLLDSDIVDEGRNTNNTGVIRMAAMLASQCLLVPGSTRPTMRRVADELKRLADQVKVKQYTQPPLVLDGVSMAEMGSSTSSGYTDSQTTGFYSIDQRAALSVEFAR